MSYPHCWVCGKPLPRWELDKHGGTCGDSPCLAYRRKNNKALVLIFVGVSAIFGLFACLCYFLME